MAIEFGENGLEVTSLFYNGKTKHFEMLKNKSHCRQLLISEPLERGKL